MVLALIITLIATSVVLMIAAVVMLKQRDVDLPNQLRARLLADVNDDGCALANHNGSGVVDPV